MTAESTCIARQAVLFAQPCGTSRFIKFDKSPKMRRNNALQLSSEAWFSVFMVGECTTANAQTYEPRRVKNLAIFVVRLLHLQAVSSLQIRTTATLT